MGKIFVAFLVGVLCVCTFSPAQALLRRDMTVVEGKVEDKDLQNRSVTIVNNATGKKESFVGEEGDLAMVNYGDEVLIIHKNDSNRIRFLRVTQPVTHK